MASLKLPAAKAALPLAFASSAIIEGNHGRFVSWQSGEDTGWRGGNVEFIKEVRRDFWLSSLGVSGTFWLLETERPYTGFVLLVL